MDFDLTLGAPGLTLGDLSPRLYGGAVRLALPGGVALTATDTGIDYVLSGLPEDRDVDYTVTGETPEGVGFSRVWRGDGSLGRTTPAVVIVPLREAGAAGLIATTLIKNGVSYGPVAVTELSLPGEPGDYALAGWPVAHPGERWLLVWEIEGVRYYRDWRVAAAPDDLAPETVIRQALSRYWLTSWLGPNLDERRISPARSLGFSGEEVGFSPDSAADVYPWTPAEVRASAGYVVMRMRELDRFDDGVTAGVEVIDGEQHVVSGEYRLYALDFDIAAPSKPRDGTDPVELVEQRRAQVERLFEGLALLPEGSSVLSIRQLGRYPTRRRAGYDDGTWRRAYLTVQVRARVRRIHAGPQEVALP